MTEMQVRQSQSQATQAKNEAPTQLQSFFAGSTGRLDATVVKIKTLIERQQRQLHRLSGVPIGGEKIKMSDAAADLGYIGHPPASDAIQAMLARLDELDENLATLETLQNQAASFA